jgi:hypothetical protein
VPLFSQMNVRIRACTRAATRLDAMLGGETMDTSRSWVVLANNQFRHAKAASVA